MSPCLAVVIARKRSTSLSSAKNAAIINWSTISQELKSGISKRPCIEISIRKDVRYGGKSFYIALCLSCEYDAVTRNLLQYRLIMNKLSTVLFACA